jgi:hypothetical protein
MPDTTQPGGAAPERGDHDRGQLRSVVVTYQGSADRQTLYPPAATESERLTHWLTADADAFRRLDEMR